jgi:ABC-type sugar transport system permease subunit
MGIIWSPFAAVTALYWEGFPLDVVTLLQGLASIQPQDN